MSPSRLVPLRRAVSWLRPLVIALIFGVPGVVRAIVRA